MADGRPRLDRATFLGLLAEAERERDRSWLRSRLVTDRRRRLLEPRTHARALLELTEEIADRLDRAKDQIARARFELLRSRVQAIADGAPLYELDRGITYATPGQQDPALAELAEIARLQPDVVAETAARIALGEDDAIAIARSWMATLPAVRRAGVQPSRSPSYGPKPTRAPIRYDDTAIVGLLDQLDQLADPRAREAVALGELGDHLQTEDLGPARVDVREDVRLVALLGVAEEIQDAIGLAIKTVERTLVEEYPRARRDDPDLQRRRQDLLGETVEPLRERLEYARSQMVLAAIRLCSMDRWPGTREQKRTARAMELARQIRRASDFDAELLADARLRSGF